MDSSTVPDTEIPTPIRGSSRSVEAFRQRKSMGLTCITYSAATKIQIVTSTKIGIFFSSFFARDALATSVFRKAAFLYSRSSRKPDRRAP